MRIFNIFAVVLLVVLAQYSCKNETISGEYYGQQFDRTGKAAKSSAVYQGLVPTDTIQTQMIGEIVEVCPKKGCWLKVSLGSEEEVFVKFKDYAFFVPKDVAGKKVLLNGSAFIEEMSVEDQRHFAEDAGSSQEEIAQITAPKRTYRFEADGVLISN